MDSLIATVYYLQWHVADSQNQERASDLFHEFHVDPPTKLTQPTFNDLYAEVTETETSDLEQLFTEWNHGSGQESDRFQALRYCEPCSTYIDGHEQAVTHAAQNHGYDALHDDAPDYIRPERSMSVGDVVERSDTYYACAPVGWQELELLEGDP